MAELRIRVLTPEEAVSQYIQYVTVTTGTEPRPLATGGMVFWIGGTTEPLNMATNDVWLSRSTTTPPTDPEEPEEPTGTAPTITTTTLNAMTINVPFTQTINYTGDTVTAVSISAGSLPTGVSPQLNNGVITIAGTPTVATGFTAVLKADNPAGSDTQSFGGSVNPAPTNPGPSNGTTLFGTNPPVGTVAAPYSDGPSNMRAGNRFYTTRNGGASIIGARLWNPVGSSDAFLNEPITAYAYVDTYNGAAIKGVTTFGHAPVRTKTGPTGKRVAGTWTEVIFDTPLQLPKIGNGVTDSLMTIAFNVGVNYVMSTTTLTDGDSVPGTAGDIHMAEQALIVRSVHSLSVNDGEVYPSGPIYGVDFIAASV